MSVPNAAAHTELAIVEINGKAFAGGLFWKPLHSVRSYMAEAKKIGRDEDWEMVTIRKGRTVIQAGFAPKGHKRLKGTYSLAAALAGQLGENWVGVFPVGPDRYALIAVYKGAVAPGFDLIGSRDEVEPKLREVYSLLSSDSQAEFSKNGRVIAPQDFAFGNESLLLQDLLTAKAIKNEYHLRSLTLGLTPREFVLIGGVAVILVSAGLAGKWWFDQKKAEEERAAARAAAQAQLTQTAQVAAGIVHPWTVMPGAPALLDACAAHLQGTPLALGGWRFNNARCAPGKAIATYMRMDGSPVAEFVAAANAATGKAPGLFEQGSTGSIESNITVTPRASDELRPTAQLLMDLTSHVQGLGNDATLTITEKPFTPNPEKPEEPAPDWTTNGFVIQTNFPPERLLRGIDTTGVRVFEVVTTLNTDSASLAWTINGELYGR